MQYHHQDKESGHFLLLLVSCVEDEEQAVTKRFVTSPKIASHDLVCLKKILLFFIIYRFNWVSDILDLLMRSQTSHTSAKLIYSQHGIHSAIVWLQRHLHRQ